MTRIRIVVVDDHEIVRRGLRVALGEEPDMVVVGEAQTGQEAVRIAREKHPDVMLLDVKLAGMDGAEACRRIRAEAPATAVVMLTSYLEDSLVLRSLVAGAKGYLIKDVEPDELKKAIRSVFRGEAVLDTKVTLKVIATVAAEGQPGQTAPTLLKQALLSQTDLAILRHLSEGRTDKEIGALVHLSPHTVRDHLKRVRGILAVHSRAAIVREAMKRGLIY